MTDCKCYYNFKAYISYPVPRAHKSKTYKYIYDSEIHAFNYTINNKRVNFRIKAL